MPGKRSPAGDPASRAARRLGHAHRRARFPIGRPPARVVDVSALRRKWRALPGLGRVGAPFARRPCALARPLRRGAGRTPPLRPGFRGAGTRGTRRRCCGVRWRPGAVSCADGKDGGRLGREERAGGWSWRRRPDEAWASAGSAAPARASVPCDLNVGSSTASASPGRPLGARPPSPPRPAQLSRDARRCRRLPRMPRGLDAFRRLLPSSPRSALRPRKRRLSTMRLQSPEFRSLFTEGLKSLIGEPRRDSGVGSDPPADFTVGAVAQPQPPAVLERVSVVPAWKAHSRCGRGCREGRVSRGRDR